MSNYIVKNYIDDNGNEPIIDWLKFLDCTTRKRILLRFDRLQDGNFGDYRQIDEYLYELKFYFGSGYRVYYTIENNTIIILISGGDKKSQSRDIKKAKEIINKMKGL